MIVKDYYLHLLIWLNLTCLLYETYIDPYDKNTYVSILHNIVLGHGYPTN